VVGFSACATPVAVVGDAPALTAVQAGMAITVGEEKDLLPFIRVVNTGAVPFVPLTWEVSNPALLSIDPVTGRARGLAAGSVVVQVRAGANQAGATQLVIDVIGEGSGVVKDVRVLPGSHHMAVGESVNLVAQVFMQDGQVNGNVV